MEGRPVPRRSSLRLVLAAAVALAGAMWLLQGLGVLATGSFMDRDPLWVAIGAAFIAAGLSLGWRAAREQRGPPNS